MKPLYCPLLSICLLLFCTCGEKAVKGSTLFTLRKSDKTGLHFSNSLTPTAAFNVFKYMYFYNGAGVGTGDFNRDGKPDLFFASNQGQNSLFLNRGDLRFEDATTAAGIPTTHYWSTGVSVVDINDDGMLDIYVSVVSGWETLSGKNQLLICDSIDKGGTPHYTDRAAQWGLDFAGFSTQAAFFDYDRDGDLDCFLLNHSVHQNGTFAERKSFEGTTNAQSGDRMFRNDGAQFTDVTAASGIQTTAIGYGLGICVSDLNLDGWPDLYIGNDFHENDYLYINAQNGTFREELRERVMHTSQFSMGVDIADVTNDGRPDIISMDMLPEDPYILKRSLGEDQYTTFQMKIGYGYAHQYTRNNLQIATPSGMYCETGLYSGVAASDWSWAPLFADWNGDGRKDLFISNGIPKRLNDIDYVAFVSNDEVQRSMKEGGVSDRDMAVIDKFPEIKLPNKIYLNGRDARFADQSAAIAGDEKTFSNGAVYADFDLDGDLDIVVNNIADEAMLYENHAAEDSANRLLPLCITGPRGNRNGIGTKLMVWTGKEVKTWEKSPVRGFLSSMEGPLYVSMPRGKVDSAFVIWPDGMRQPFAFPGDGVQSSCYAVTYTEDAASPFSFAPSSMAAASFKVPVEEIAAGLDLRYLHRENAFNEFDREPLVPHMTSREGPAMAVGDANGDGLDDVFIGSSKWQKPGYFLQNSNGRFVRQTNAGIDSDSTFEETAALWSDVNGDGVPDLLLAAGGNEFYGKSEYLTPRLFLNDGRGGLTKKNDAFDSVFINASAIVTGEFTGDSYVDIFLAGRTVPFAYGEIPRSYLLVGDGRGGFRDVTSSVAPALLRPGMLTDVRAVDMDRDGDLDLLTAQEWGGIDWWQNNRGKFERIPVTVSAGWWNFAFPFDADGDGDLDVLAGNLGLNSRLTASPKKPLRLLFSDFDGNGTREQLLTYFIGDRELPFANREELLRQMPGLKKKFLYAADMAKASLEDLFGEAALQKAQRLEATELRSAIFYNDDAKGYRMQPLPWELQLSPLRTAAVWDANGDALPDLLVGGNFYENNIEMGRYDADMGSVLINRGKGAYGHAWLEGWGKAGEWRALQSIRMPKNGKAMLVGRNNDSLQVLRKSMSLTAK